MRWEQKRLSYRRGVRVCVCARRFLLFSPPPPPLHPNGKPTWSDGAAVKPRSASPRINGYTGKHEGKVKKKIWEKSPAFWFRARVPQGGTAAPCGTLSPAAVPGAACGRPGAGDLGQGEQQAQRGPAWDGARRLLPRGGRLRRGRAAQFPRKGGGAAGLLGVTTPRAQEPCPSFPPEPGG